MPGRTPAHIFVGRCLVWVTRRTEKDPRRAMGERLRSERQPFNRADPKAIIVLDEDGEGAGFVPKPLAKELAPLLDTDVVFEGGKVAPGREAVYLPEVNVSPVHVDVYAVSAASVAAVQSLLTIQAA